MDSTAYVLRRYGLSLALLAGGWLGGCTANSSSNDTCEVFTECGADEICQDGSCVEGPCAEDSDCGGDYMCVRTECVLPTERDTGAPDVAPDADAGTDADTGTETTTDTGPATDTSPDSDTAVVTDTNTEDGDAESIPVAILSTDPPDGALGVPVDATVSVVFNQPMNEAHFTVPGQVLMYDVDGGELDRIVEYHAESNTVTIVPNGGLLLEHASPYAVRLSRDLGAADGSGRLDENTYFEFSTVGHPGAGFHQELANTYAPVFYQQVEDTGIDTFTEIAFDGDDDPRNNFEQRSGAHAGHVYYAVIESETHFFVSYFLYYPGIELPSGATHEHDSLGVLVVVRKTDDRLGQFQAMNTLYQSYSLGWAAPSSWYEAGTDVGDVEGRFDEANFEDNTHAPVFVESGRHTLCIPSQATSQGPCSPGTGADAPFDDGVRGLVYRAGEVAMRAGEGDDDALTYLPLPLVEQFWAIRHQTSDGDLFEGAFTYRPPAGREGNGVTMPSAFASDDPDARGELPFSFEGLPVSDRGAWYVDPAHVVGQLIDFPDPVSDAYCFNPFLGIDLRGESEACTTVDE